MILICGMEMLGTNRRVSMGLFASVYFVFMICARLKMKVSATHPVALTTGELRDRVFELAKRAAIELRQVFILPAGKSQLANAYASRNRIVMFTDYLLSHLSKREVTAIAAHEITHLQKRHILWKSIAWIGLIFSPYLFGMIVNFSLGLLMIPAALAGHSASVKIVSMIGRVQEFSEMDLIYYTIGLALFYLQSRYLENVADAGAVQLTGDPEAVITGLLKVGRLNLLPTQWGRTTGATLTHPSTLKRVQRVARIGQVSPERMQQILTQYEQSERQSAVSDFLQEYEGEKFSDTQIPSNRVVTAARNTQSAMTKLWILLFMHVAPAVAVAWAVHHWHVKWAMTAYIGGAAAITVLYAIVAHWMGLWGRISMQREFEGKLAEAGIPINERYATFVGLSPHATPRFYVSDSNWDRGYLFFARGKLCYVGDQVRFALAPSQVRNVRLGPGKPGWFPVARIYLDWVDESGVVRTWSIVSLMPCSLWSIRKQSRDLYANVRRWNLAWMNYPEPSAALAQLRAPSVGEVTSRSFKSLHAFGPSLGRAIWTLLLATMVCTAFNVPRVWYACSVVVLLRFYEGLPVWFYKEPLEAVRQPISEPIVLEKV